MKDKTEKEIMFLRLFYTEQYSAAQSPLGLLLFLLNTKKELKGEYWKSTTFLKVVTFHVSTKIAFF